LGSVQFFPPAQRAERRTIDDGPAQIQAPASPELGEEHFVQTLPDTGALPPDQAAPTGAPRAAAHFTRQHLPRQPGSQHKENAGQRRTISYPGTAHPPAAPTCGLGQQWFEAHPEAIID
jgi:hypothetical protein